MKKVNTKISGQVLFPALIFALVFLFCISGATLINAEEAFKDGRLYLADGSTISLEKFADLAKGYDYILIGENHDAPHHHQMQANLLAALAQAGLRPAVGFEMLYFRNQNLLAAFNRREIKVAELEGASNWANSWTYPFEIYAPIFEVAEQFDLPVYGLNISKATLDLVRAKGFDGARDTVPGEERPDLPREVIWPKPEQVEHLNKTRENLAKRRTESKTGETAMPEPDKKPPVEAMEAKKADPAQGPLKAGDPQRFLLIQSLWDTSMAESAFKARQESGRPVVIIAGSGHVESGYGIAHRLNTLAPGQKILLVLPLAKPFDAADEKLKKSADVFFASRPSILSLGLVLKAEADRAIVDEIKGGSRAERAGLRIGDQVVSFEEREIKSPGDFHSAIAVADLEDKRSELPEKRPKVLVINRNGLTENLTLR